MVSTFFRIFFLKFLLTFCFAIGFNAYGAVEISRVDLGNSTTLKPNGLLQLWSVNNENGSPRNENFRLRRAEMKIGGTVATESLRYFIMVDPAKLVVPIGGRPVTTTTMVQDLALGYKITPRFEILFGQYKTPTTAEGLDSSAQLPLPERSFIGRSVGDKREVGVELAYKEDLWNTALMLSHGSPIGRDAYGGLSDMDYRFEMTPLKGLGVGFFYVIGSWDDQKKGRLGMNARCHLSSVALRTEYAQAKDQGLFSQGMTNEVQYNINENIETVARYEFFLPGFGQSNLSQAQTLGLSYWVRNWNSKLQISGTAMQNMAASNGSPVPVDGANNKEIIFAIQAAI